MRQPAQAGSAICMCFRAVADVLSCQPARPFPSCSCFAHSHSPAYGRTDLASLACPLRCPEESDAKRLMREAADYFGMPTSVSEAVGSVQAWCAGWVGAWASSPAAA